MLTTVYRWPRDQKLSISILDRSHVLLWFRHLKDKKLAAGTQRTKILNFRVYLRWLYDNGHLDIEPECLVRASDMPPMPLQLPRPLSPDADQALRLKLARSTCLYHQALLLMRQTGVRIGELVSLDFDCIRSDVHGNRFVKVPLVPYG